MLPFKNLKVGDMVLDEDYTGPDPDGDLISMGVCIVASIPVPYALEEDELWQCDINASVGWSYNQISTGDYTDIFVSRLLR